MKKQICGGCPILPRSICRICRERTINIRMRRFTYYRALLQSCRDKDWMIFSVRCFLISWDFRKWHGAAVRMVIRWAPRVYTSDVGHGEAWMIYAQKSCCNGKRILSADWIGAVLQKAMIFVSIITTDYMPKAA